MIQWLAGQRPCGSPPASCSRRLAPSAGAAPSTCSSLLSPRAPSASGRGALASSRQEQLQEPFDASRTCTPGLPSLLARGWSSSPRTRGIMTSTWTSSSPWRLARLLIRADPETRRRTGELKAPPLEGQVRAGVEAAAAEAGRAGGNPLRLRLPPLQGSPVGRRKGDHRRPGGRLSLAALARALLRNVAGRPVEVLSPPLPAAAGRCLRPRGDTRLRTIVNSPPSAAAHWRRGRTRCSGLGLLAAAPTPPPTVLARRGSYSVTALSRPGAARLLAWSRPPARWLLVPIGPTGRGRRWMGQPPRALDRGTMPHGPTPTLLPRAGDGSPHHPRAATPPPPGVSGDPADAATMRLALAAAAPTPAPRGGCLSREPSGSLPCRASPAPAAWRLPPVPRAFVDLPPGGQACSLFCLLSRASWLLAHRALPRRRLPGALAPSRSARPGHPGLVASPVVSPRTRLSASRWTVLPSVHRTADSSLSGLGYFVFFGDSSDSLSRRV
jgi:hypothetical protein